VESGGREDSALYSPAAASTQRPPLASARVRRSVFFTPDLDIGVIYTHERQWMSRLLETMSASGQGLRMRLILVDNASTDGVERWRRCFAQTRVLHSVRRLSYAANLNRILDVASARYVLLMNTDMYFDPHQQCLRQMVAFMDNHPRCGIAGCRLYHSDGSEAHAARRFQTPPVILARRCGLGRFLRDTVDHYLYSERPREGTWPCDWLSGCFLMVRREAIEQVGCFDESYGKYFEDVDICLRMARAGWQVMYHGEVSCCHLEQRGSRRLFSADVWRHLRAYVRWLCKWGLTSSPVPTEQMPHRPPA
jgi:N-acetylglucosaminyl-diphospho-decaprenol L-rhamnosyltransferase